MDRRLVTARRLLLQSVVAEVLQALEQAGVPALLLKGEATAAALYGDDEVRLTRDVDVLVRDTDRANAVVRGLGFVPSLPGAHPHEHSPHAVTWWRGDGVERVELDLHSSFHGIGVPPAELWEVWSSSSTRILVGGAPVRVLGPMDACLVVALHRGRSTGGSAQEDMRRLLETATPDLWRSIAARAERLGATEALRTGLSLAPGGREVLRDLGLGEALTARELLVRDSPGLSVGVYDLLRRPSLRRLLQELWPSPAMLLRNHPYGRRSRTARAVARGHRILTLVLRLPAALLRVARAAAPRRRPRAGRRGGDG